MKITQVLPWPLWHSAWNIELVQKVCLQISHTRQHVTCTVPGAHFTSCLCRATSHSLLEYRCLLTHSRPDHHLRATSSGLKHGLPFAIVDKTVNFLPNFIFLIWKVGLNGHVYKQCSICQHKSQRLWCSQITSP